MGGTDSHGEDGTSQVRLKVILSQVILSCHMVRRMNNFHVRERGFVTAISNVFFVTINYNIPFLEYSVIFFSSFDIDVFKLLLMFAFLLTFSRSPFYVPFLHFTILEKTGCSCLRSFRKFAVFHKHSHINSFIWLSGIRICKSAS